MSLLSSCSTHVSSNNRTNNNPAVHSPSKPPSHCSCPSDPPQSYDRQHQSTCCYPATHAVTRPPRPRLLQQPHVTPSTVAPLPPSAPPTPLSHTPLLTKLISFRRLNRTRLAHSGAMSSSVTFGCVRCELHVRGGRQGDLGCGRQARDALHVTQYHEARLRVNSLL